MPGPTLGATLRCHRDAALAARVAAMLRPHVDHLTIAAEERMGVTDLEQLAGVDAELIRLPVCEPNNRTIQFLHDRCPADWHLLLDGDEIPSLALLERLRALVARPGITHVRLLCRWLWPDGGSELLARPWNNDWHTRLARTAPGFVVNEGAPHSATRAVGPALWVDDAPFYHAVLLVENEEQRALKVRAYNARGDTPTFAFGLGFNEAFYLPEVRAQRPRSAPLPDRERAHVEAALAGTAPASRALGPLPEVVALADIDACWPRRPPDTARLRSHIEVLDPDLSFVRGEQRWLTIAVENRGPEPWGWGQAPLPAVSVAYAWELEGSGTDRGDGARAPLPAPVAPGERAVMIAMVQAPLAPGAHTLELAMAGDGSEWGPPGARLRVEVTPGP